MTKIKIIIIVIIIMACIKVNVAFGQNVEEPDVQRKGFVIGAVFGGGILNLSGNNLPNKTTGVYSIPNIKVGTMLNEKLALLVIIPGANYKYEDNDRSFEAFIPSLQYWFKDRWWINGGIGLTMDFPAFYTVNDPKEADFFIGPSFSASTGYEIIRKTKFVIDIQSRVHIGRSYINNNNYRDGASFVVGLGFNFY